MEEAAERETFEEAGVTGDIEVSFLKELSFEFLIFVYLYDNMTQIWLIKCWGISAE